MGVSGSGKGTLRKNLESWEYDELHYLKSYVSRPMRDWEVEWDIYHFISKEQFLADVEAWEFLEYAFVHNSAYYWTKKTDVLEGIEQWKKMIKEVDVQGLVTILSDYPELKEQITSIFLEVPESTVRERILLRDASISNHELEKRVDSISDENHHAEKICDHIIDGTQSPEKVLHDVLDILKK